MAPVGGGKTIAGEGRVTYLRAKYAVLSKPGLDGGIFVVPSSILGQQRGYPDMTSLLQMNDMVKFEALPQEERNGIKWQALDGTVEVTKKAADIEYRGTGVVTFLDERLGQYGFLHAERGDVWFSASAIRPETNDVGKALKKGQTVAFVAVQQPQQQCPFRATLVHSKNYKRPATTTTLAPTAKKPENKSSGWRVPESGSSGSSRPSTPVNAETPNVWVQPSPRPAHLRTQPLDIILSDGGASASPLRFGPPRRPPSESPVFFGTTDSQPKLAMAAEPTPPALAPPGFEMKERGASKEQELSAAQTTPANNINYNVNNNNINNEGSGGSLLSGALAGRLFPHVLIPTAEEPYGKLLASLRRAAHQLAGIKSSECPICEPSERD